MLETLTALKPELDILSSRYVRARSLAVQSGLHRPYEGTIPGEKALERSMYALQTHLAKMDMNEDADRWTWYTTVLISLLEEQILWLVDDHIALEHLVHLAMPSGGNVSAKGIQAMATATGMSAASSSATPL
jgi:hypothetical protein